MEQRGGFARDWCVVGLSKHLPDYLPYFEEQKNHVESIIFYAMSRKKIKHHNKTPILHLLTFQVNWVEVILVAWLFACHNYIYLFWVDVNLAGWLFSSSKIHLLVFQVKKVDVDLNTYEMRCTYILHEKIIEFQILQIGIPIRWLSRNRISKKSNQNIRKWKWNWNSASNGGPRNLNCKKLKFPT